MIRWLSLGAAILLFGSQSYGLSSLFDGVATSLTMQTHATTPLIVSTATATSARPISTDVLLHTDWDPPEGVIIGRNHTYNYSLTEIVPFDKLDLVLCQTNASNEAPLNSANTWTVVQIFSNATYNRCSQSDEGSKCNEQFSVAFFNGTADSRTDLSSFFFCFTTSPFRTMNYFSCESYSQLFDIAFKDGSFAGSLSLPSPVATPSTALLLTANTKVVDTSEWTSATSSSSMYSTTSSTIVTIASPIQPPTSSPPTTTAQVHKPKGLSTSALAAIIVGSGLAFLIALLLAFFCFRRRSRLRSNMRDSNATNHVLLSKPDQAASSSRDFMLEKTTPRNPASTLETPLTRPLMLPQDPRQSYKSLNASAPYKGIAASVPRRKQLPPVSSSQNTAVHSRNNSHAQSLLSKELTHDDPTPAHGPFTWEHASIPSPLHRNPSTTSQPLDRGASNASEASRPTARGPLSPSSTIRPASSEFEAYQDVPFYGDARHTPTLYQSHPSSQTSFLGDEGLSEEEIARLDEEEIRIDEAIAEAEREEGRDRR